MLLASLKLHTSSACENMYKLRPYLAHFSKMISKRSVG